MPIYKCEKCGKVHRTEDDVCCQSDQLAESKPGGVSANGDGSLSCASQATTGNEVNRHFPPILDACCGSRMFWFDHRDPRAVFVDNRRERHTLPDVSSKGGSRELVIEPDVQADFTALPFADETFAHVVFDPPHFERNGARSWVGLKYGTLAGDWPEMLRKGFAECFRVLKPGGTLVFKWCADEIPVSRILALTPERPLYGHKSGKQQKTHWIVFVKLNPTLHPPGCSAAEPR